jgi:hypothetical protein
MGVLVTGIELTQTGEEFGCDGNFAGLVVFGFGNVNDESLAIDVLGFDGKSLADAQAALIQDSEKGTVASIAECPQQQGDFIAGQDMGKWLLTFDVDLFPDIPVETEVVAVKGAQAADSLVDGGGREFAVVLDVDEEVEHASRRNCGEIDLGKVFQELADPAVITVAGFFGDTFKLDEAGEVRIPKG